VKQQAYQIYAETSLQELQSMRSNNLIIAAFVGFALSGLIFVAHAIGSTGGQPMSEVAAD
jgi:hypothetical protein